MPQTPLRICILLSLSWLSASLSLGQTRPATGIPTAVTATPFGDLTAQHRVMQWKVEQGLPQNNITSLLQTSDGYIWIGTVFGLVRYDGVRFTPFEKSTLPLMEETDDHILGIAEDTSNVLWVCAHNGLLRFKNHEWFAYKSGGSILGPLQPTSLCKAAEGGVWVGTQGLLLRFSEEGLTQKIPITVPDLRSIRYLQEDLEGNLWFGDRYHILKRTTQTGEFQTFDATTDGHWFRYLHMDHKGRICYGGDERAMRIEEGKPRTLLEFSAKADKSPMIHFDYLDDGKDHRWLALDGRLRELIPTEEGNWKLGEILDHPGLTTVEILLRDSEGNLWIGTKDDGLLFVQEKRFSTLQLASNREDSARWSVCVDEQDGVWFGTVNGLCCWRSNSVLNIPSLVPPPGQLQVYSIIPDRKNGLWVGFGEVGVHRWTGTAWEIGPLGILEPKDRTKVENVRATYLDPRGVLWFGMGSGLYRFDGTNHVHIPLPIPTTQLDVRAIHEDQRGAFWVGTYTSGFLIRAKDNWRTFGKPEGLSDLQITCFLEGQNGTMWIGTGSGLVRYKDGTLRTLTRQQGMFDNVVNCVLEDDEAHLWISCNRGIFRISIHDANEVLDGKVPGLTSMPFGESDGMASAETNGGSQPSGWKSTSGLLWFPTAKGLVRVDPKHVRSNARPPLVVVEQVRANGKIQFGDGLKQGIMEGQSSTSGSPASLGGRSESTRMITLAPGEARVVEIRYTANSFEEPTKVRFQYQLIGHDKTWQDANDRRITHYTNLDPGRYEFQLRACNNHGLWGPTGNELVFTVQPYFHQTWWFYGLCTFAVVGIAAGVQSYRLHMQRRFLKLENQHALEKERARIAKDVHDDLGARLTQLGLLSELAESPGFKEQVTESSPLPKISTLARDAVRSLDEIVWAVSPGKNSLDQLAGYLVQAAQDLIRPSGIRFNLQMPTHVPPLALSEALRHNIFLVCKEALNNAVKHSDAQTLHLELSHCDENAVIVIQDDGKGFHYSEAETLGNGLANMRKRAESVNAHFHIRSEPSQGTRIEVRFPLTPDNP